MADQVKAIAERIKELREICEYTPQQAAEAAGVPVEQYMTFEEGGRDIPVSVRYALADGYMVELGTLLTGGYGFVLGSVLGVLVLGVIQTIISFDGTLSSWWTKIVIGALLFAFIVLQRAVNRRTA